jgi:hypothetical protein
LETPLFTPLFVWPWPLIDHSRGTGSLGGAAQPATNKSATTIVIPEYLNTNQLCERQVRTQAVSVKPAILDVAASRVSAANPEKQRIDNLAYHTVQT